MNIEKLAVKIALVIGLIVIIGLISIRSIGKANVIIKDMVCFVYAIARSSRGVLTLVSLVLKREVWLMYVARFRARQNTSADIIDNN